MPFTLAHPAAVLSFYHVRWLSLSGLIIGAMTPDFEYFLTLHLQGRHGHSLWGLWYFDLPLGVTAVWIFQRVLRDACLRHIPLVLQQRFVCCYRQHWQPSWFVLFFSVWFGALTHILWDGFTHAGRFSQWLPMLLEPSFFGASWPWYRVLQHSSTLGGFIAIGWFVWRLPIGNTSAYPVCSGWRKWGFWLVAVLLAFGLFWGRIVWLGDIPTLGNVVVSMIAFLIVGVFIVSLIDCLVVKADNEISC